MAMTDQLPGRRARVGEPQMIAEVVQPGFQDLQHLLAGDAAALQRTLVHAPELSFEQSVIITELLLLDKTESIIGVLAARLRTVHARAIIAAFKIFRRAEDGHAEPAAYANARTCVTSHFLKGGELRVKV